MEQINYETIISYEAGCEALALSAADRKLPFTGKNLTGRQKSTNAHHKLLIINEAMHIGYTGEKYYEPRFYNSGSGWVYNHYDNWLTGTLAGPRLQFADYERMRFATTTHEAIYNDLL